MNQLEIMKFKIFNKERDSLFEKFPVSLFYLSYMRKNKQNVYTIILTEWELFADES